MNILRWILVLPISILCCIIFPYLYQKVIGIVISEDSFASTFIMNGVSYFLQGSIFIVTAYFIIPNFKSKALQGFLILWLLTVIFGEFYLHSTNRENVGVWNTILRILGAILAYINLRLENESDNLMEKVNSQKEEKKVPLTEIERHEIISKIENYAKINPQYKEHVEQKLKEKKEELDRKAKD